MAWVSSAVAAAAVVGLLLVGGEGEAQEPDELQVGDKTLVAWTTPASLEQSGGAVLSIGGRSDLFDAIVFGEIAPRRWMAGSNFHRRTHRAQDAWPDETETEGLVQVAIVYEGRRVTLYRNGEEYAAYEMGDEPAPFSSRSMVLIGLRHFGAARGYYAGTVEEARIYDVALDAATIASLEPNQPSDPEPVGWWTFQGGSLKDRMGNFPPGELVGNARVAKGKLHLDGEGSFLMARAEPSVRREEGTWPKYHVTVLPDEGIAMPYDANGCIYWKGKYHLMYIFQRADGGHCWGHLSSPDLLNWTYHPTALEPNPGDPDRGIFSGNAFVNKDGVPMLCWFGIDAGVCVATATDDDLIHWEKHPNNPVVPMPKEGEPGHGVYTVWDPYLWLEDDTYMCLLGGNRLPNGRDTLYLCTSPDLVDWTPKHAFYEGDPSWRREDEDCSCPDFFRLGEKHALLCISHSIGARVYIGELRGETFYPEQHVRMNWPGGMFFAPESLEDYQGRRIFWAWVTDPRTRPAQELTGSGFQSLPRVLSLAEDGTVRITPVEELRKLRSDHKQRRGITVPADDEVLIEGIGGAHIELSAEMDVGDADAVGLKVCCAPDGSEETGIVYDAEAKLLRIDMSRSTTRDDVTYGSPPFTSHGLQNAGDNTTPYATVDAPFELEKGETLSLRVFIDGPMLEVFANDRQCVTQVIFPESRESIEVKAFAQGGGATLASLDAWRVRGLKFQDRRKVD